MKIVGIAACTSGIAHTYIAKEKLLKAAASLGHALESYELVLVVDQIIGT